MKYSQRLRTLIVLVALSSSTFAVAQTYEKGQKDLHVGIGLVNFYYNSGYNGLVPPINASFEIGVTDEIGVGGMVGFSTARSDKFGNDNYWRGTYILIGARGAYHFDIFDNPELDTYAGLMLGYHYANWSLKDDDGFDYIEPDAGYVAWSGFGGVRYQFKEKLGVYGEIGFGYSLLNIGLRFKL